MKPNFTGPSYTVGVEEELMLLNPETWNLANAIERLLADAGDEEGDIKPELHESVLEIATRPCRSVRQAGEELRDLRRRVAEIAGRRELRIGSAGTHPFARWEDQRISARPRYRDLIDALRFVARQEVIFGLHVHVGMDDADKAIHVANGMRVHVPLLLALSANSPLWRGRPTGLASTRMPIFRQFPRVGMPPAYHDWADFEERIGAMVRAKTIEDYTYLWYDVRPHANFGTVEVRAMDAQTRLEHTVGLAALIQAMVKELAEHFESGEPLGEYPFEMLDENRWVAARHGLDGNMVDLPSYDRVSTRALAQRVVDRVRGHAQDLGAGDELAGIDDLLEHGNGAHRQSVIYEANHDLEEVVREIVQATVPDQSAA